MLQGEAITSIPQLTSKSILFSFYSYCYTPKIRGETKKKKKNSKLISYTLARNSSISSYHKETQQKQKGVNQLPVYEQSCFALQLAGHRDVDRRSSSLHRLIRLTSSEFDRQWRLAAA